MPNVLASLLATLSIRPENIRRRPVRAAHIPDPELSPADLRRLRNEVSTVNGIVADMIESDEGSTVTITPLVWDSLSDVSRDTLFAASQAWGVPLVMEVQTMSERDFLDRERTF